MHLAGVFTVSEAYSIFFMPGSMATSRQARCWRVAESSILIHSRQRDTLGLA